MYAAYDLLKELRAAGPVVVPGHDPDVRARFPGRARTGDGEAVRIEKGRERA